MVIVHGMNTKDYWVQPEHKCAKKWIMESTGLCRKGKELKAWEINMQEMAVANPEIKLGIVKVLKEWPGA